MPLQSEIDKLNKEIRLIENGCYLSVAVGLLGMLFYPNIEGKVISGMLFFGGMALRGAPAAHDALHRILNRDDG